MSNSNPGFIRDDPSTWTAAGMRHHLKSGTMNGHFYKTVFAWSDSDLADATTRANTALERAGILPSDTLCPIRADKGTNHFSQGALKRLYAEAELFRSDLDAGGLFHLPHERDDSPIPPGWFRWEMVWAGRYPDTVDGVPAYPSFTQKFFQFARDQLRGAGAVNLEGPESSRDADGSPSETSMSVLGMGRKRRGLSPGMDEGRRGALAGFAESPGPEIRDGGGDDDGDEEEEEEEEGEEEEGEEEDASVVSREESPTSEPTELAPPPPPKTPLDEVEVHVGWITQQEEDSSFILEKDFRSLRTWLANPDLWQYDYLVVQRVRIEGDSEGQDFYDLIEWIGTQAWNSNKVAITGISSFGMAGFWAAMQQPPHLTCVISYEALCNMYQGLRKGGVYSSNFHEHWYHNVVEPQARTLKANEEPRADYVGIVEAAEYPDQGPWPVLARVHDLSKIQVPIYLAGNWTDAELHLPGNINAFNGVSSRYKWLEIHTGNHLGAYYERDHAERQKQFLDYFLKDKHDNGMLDVPRVRLLIRKESGDFFRDEEAFHIPDATDVSYYLTADNKLSDSHPSTPPKAFEYTGLQGSLTFDSEPLNDDLEILGTPYLELEVATEAEDLDLLVYMRNIKASGEPVIVRGNHDEPNVSFCRGFWRLSHRDEYPDFLTYRVPQQRFAPKAEVVKGKSYRVCVPLNPTSFVLETGSKLQIEVGSVDERTMIPPMRHDGGDRTVERFGGMNTLFSNGRIVIPTVKR